MDPAILGTGTRGEVWQHVREVYRQDVNKWATDRWVGMATGQLHRFVRECAVGDYVLYYDPPNKHVRICRVTSPAAYRDFALDESDIEDLERRGRHPDFCPVTLGELLATWVIHDLNHVGQIVNVLARQHAESVGPWRAFLGIVEK